MPMRHVQGETNPFVAKFAAAQACEVGDFMFLDGTDYKPAGAFDWNTNIGTTQLDFAAVFAGVSDRKRVAAETVAEDGMILTEGKYWYPCAAISGSAVQPGTPVGPAKQSGDLLEPQKIVVVADDTLAIGKVCRLAAIGDTEMQIQLFTRHTHIDPSDFDT